MPKQLTEQVTGQPGAKPNIPGGAHASEQNKDGTWNIYSVPIFAEHDVTVKGQTLRVGREWQDKAHERQASRMQNDNYMAPLHVHHHALGASTQPAGFFRITEVSQAQYDGNNLWMTFADFLQVPDDVYRRVRAGELSYRSVEIHDIMKPEIDSLALLNDEVPFFRMSLLTIGREAPLKGGQEVSEVIMAAAATPVEMYRAFGDGTRVCINAASIGRKEMPKTKEQLAAEVKKYQDDLAEEIRKKKEEEEKGENLALEGEEGGEGLDKAKVAATLMSVAQQITQLATALGQQAGPEQQGGAPAPVEMALKPGVPHKNADTGQISQAELNSIPSEYRAPFLKLMGRVDSMERGTEVEAAVSAAVTELETYGADADSTRKTLYSIARKHGVKAMRSYVDGAKTYATPDPAPDWDDPKDLAAKVGPRMQKYARLGQDAYEKALKYADEFDTLSKSMSFSFGRSTFVDEQLRGEGFDIPIVEEKKEA